MSLECRYVAAETVRAAEPQTPLEKLRVWCEENIAMTPWNEHTVELLLASVRGEGRRLGVMCSPAMERIDGQHILVLNPWPDQPLVFDGEGA